MCPAGSALRSTPEPKLRFSALEPSAWGSRISSCRGRLPSARIKSSLKCSTPSRPASLRRKWFPLVTIGTSARPPRRFYRPRVQRPRSPRIHLIFKNCFFGFKLNYRLISNYFTSKSFSPLKAKLNFNDFICLKRCASSSSPANVQPPPSPPPTPTYFFPNVKNSKFQSSPISH